MSVLGRPQVTSMNHGEDCCVASTRVKAESARGKTKLKEVKGREKMKEEVRINERKGEEGRQDEDEDGRGVRGDEKQELQ